MSDQTNQSTADSKAARKRCSGIAVFMAESDLSDNVVGDLARVVIGSSRSARQVCHFPFLAGHGAALPRHVLLVLGARAEKEMRGVDTSAVVTLVTDAEIVGGRSVHQSPAQAMDTDRRFSCRPDPDASVASVIYGTLPLPAPSWDFLHAGEKTLGNRAGSGHRAMFTIARGEHQA